MSSFHTPRREIRSLRVWYDETFGMRHPHAERVGRPERRRRHPDIDHEQMDCRTCGKHRLSNSPFQDQGRWCPLCYRFRVSAPVLRSSGYCSCPCDCNSDLNSDEDTISTDPDYVPGSPDSTVSSDTDHEASNDGSNTNLTREAHNLSMGLTAWEIHDLERLGHSSEMLMRHFPETVFVHNRFRSPIRARPRPFKECRVCQKERMPEIEDAITRGVVVICSACGRPDVRYDQDAQSLSLLNLRACFCCCFCLKEPVEVVSGPIWFPFYARLPGSTPSPAALKIIQELGFCVRDNVSEELRDAVANNEAKPSYYEIVTGTIPEYLKSTRSERLAAHLDRIEEAAFPNGVLKNPHTDSGLPNDLETAIRQIDPNAFGHVTRARYDPFPDLNRVHELSWEEQQRWDRIVAMRIGKSLLIGTEHESAAQLALWAAEYEHDFGLEDDDGDSVCSVDDLGEPAWEAMNQKEIDECGCGAPECGETKHKSRHYRRKLERVAARGGFPVYGGEVRFAVAMQLEYEDRVQRQGLLAFKGSNTDSVSKVDCHEREVKTYSRELLEYLLRSIWVVAPPRLYFTPHERVLAALATLLSRNGGLISSIEGLCRALEEELRREPPDEMVRARPLPQPRPPRTHVVPFAVQPPNVNAFNNRLAAQINDPGSGIDPSEINGGQSSAFSDASGDDDGAEEQQQQQQQQQQQ